MPVQQAYATLSDTAPHAPGRARSSDVARDGFSLLQIGVVLLVSLAAVTMLLVKAELSVAIWSRSNLPYLLAATITFALRSDAVTRRWRHAGALRACATYYALFTGLALAGAVASYPIAALTHGYADATLQRMDVALGFDWLAWYRVVAHHRFLQLAGTACYQSIYITPAILLGWFAWTGQRGEAHRFLACFWLSAVVTLALFTLMPAIGPLSYLWPTAVPYMPVSETWQLNLIPALRAHEIHVVDLGQLRGIVSAPSFHAAAGTLYLWTAWRTPRLRWPLVALIALMLLATPVEGTHYLTDMLIGAAVAAGAIATVDMAMTRRRDGRR